jgi:hypothetical protein
LDVSHTPKAPLALRQSGLAVVGLVYDMLEYSAQVGSFLHSDTPAVILSNLHFIVAIAFTLSVISMRKKLPLIA